MAIDNLPPKKRFKVRAECPQCAGGYIAHMTTDELLELAVHDNCDLSCPACGLIHLNREEIDLLENEKIVFSERYQEIKQQAEGAQL